MRTLFSKLLKKNIKKYNQNQLTRTVVHLVFDTIVLKYWTVDHFIHWLIKSAEVFEGDNTRDGLFALFLRPPPQGI